MPPGNANLWNLLACPGQGSQESPAILAPGKRPLAHGQLASIIAENVRQLRKAGFGPQDRIAMVLPNGPEMGVALLTVMASGVAAPLNPNYSAAEFDFYLGDLEARALLIPAGMENASRKPAAARGIPVIELEAAASGEAGAIRLALPTAGPPVPDVQQRPNDIALLLHTSGTTSRPKLVPLTQANLYFSADNIRLSFALSPEDRCLNVMPLFHIHGLVAALLSSLAAGGSVVCAPGFQAHEFLGWMREFRPTWYTAVPTIHQSVLARAREAQDFAVPGTLRFVRSCSSSLAPSIMSELESRFGVPVCEAYGMTEAAHQIACNPLPPRPRKPGSVGLSSGVHIAVLDESGRPVPAGLPGEVAIHGRTVTSGYLNNKAANEAAFSGAWLRTGDIGYLDPDGYLFLNGRSKELINRGGEKISPREVEDALLTHPAIAQAAAFAMPDERLGEEVAVAAVLRPGAAASEMEIRSHAAGRLAYFKVPKHVFIVGEIPKGATGKVQRVGMAERLGLTPQKQAVPAAQPASDMMEAGSGVGGEVLELMRRYCGAKLTGIDANFFQAGGDSIQAGILLAEVKKRYGADIALSAFVLDATARNVAGIVSGGAAPVPATLVPIRKAGANPPFFCVHPHDGRVTLFYGLAGGLDAEQPFYAFQAVSGETLRPAAGGIERMAASYVQAMKALRPRGPYYFGGYCFGALVAFEMARILVRQEDAVGLLALIDSYAPGGPRPSFSGPGAGVLLPALDRIRRIRPLLSYISQLPREQKRRYVIDTIRSQVAGWRSAARGAGVPAYSLPGREDDDAWQFCPGAYEGRAVLFRPTREPLGFRSDPGMGWGRYVKGGLEIEAIRGYHRALIFKPSSRLLAESLNRRLRRSMG